MENLDTVAENLRWMVENGDTADSAVALAPQVRSIENAAIPVTPAQLEGIFGYGPTRSGVQINEQTAITFTAVFAAVRILSESIGMLPVGIFRGDDDEDVKIRAREHPAYPLLRWQPNPESTAVVLKETVQANLSLWGNGYARILQNHHGDPVQILPLLSARTYPTRYAGQLRYVVEGEGGGRFAPEEIIHIPGLSLNGVQGLSPVAYAREAIAMGKAAELFGAAFYGNGAAMSGVLQTPGILKPEQQAQLRESISQMHAGVGNAFKMLLLQGGTTYTRLGVPPDEAQFLESRKFQVTEIARVFRIPPHMLGDLERSTHSNIEQMSLEFLVYTLLPWIEKWEHELTRKLCGVKGEYHVKFDDSRLLRVDTASRQSFYQIGKQWGFLNSDEIRAGEGKPPIPDGLGKTYWAPVNMVPQDKFGQTPPAAPPPAHADPALADKPKRSQLALAATRSVFEDAIGRMLRKESNAAGRGKTDEAFYGQHREHVREALYPAARTLLAIAGHALDARTGEKLLATLDEFAAERHAGIGGEALELLAAAKAAEIPGKLLMRIEDTP